MSIKIINWNILAPGLFLYFWRSSYGLSIKNNNEDYYSKDYYDNVNKTRILNIIEQLKTYDADIICLQEVTDLSYDYLENKTIQQFIADKLGYKLTSESFKQSKFNYWYPPEEQPYRNSPKTLSIDSGVTTLIKIGSNVKHVLRLGKAEDFGPSNIFPSGVGSPFTIDEFEVDDKTIYVVNTHIRMKYPHIEQPLNEFYDRMSRVIPLAVQEKAIVTGDFNAGNIKAAKDLFRSELYRKMFDIKGHELIDDHVFIGNNLRLYKNSVEHDKSIKLLEMNLNAPTSNPKWRNRITPYKHSPVNNDLINQKTVTTDHYPIIIKIEFELEKREPHMIGGNTKNMKRKYLKYKTKYLCLKKELNLR